MDKELDDLLDSALGDFDKKLTINEGKTSGSDATTSNVSIERMNLYVDDELDYDDRPTPKVSVNPSKPPPSNPNLDPNLGFDMNDENLKLFEGIFNDAKNKDSMKDLKNMFDMFQNSTDEKGLLDNFQKVMSELVNEETNLDEDLDDFENIEELNFLKNLAGVANQMPNTDVNNATENKPASKSKKSETPKDENEKQTPMQKLLDDMNKNSEKVLKNSSNNGFPFGNDLLSSLTETLNASEGSSTGDDALDGATSMMMQPILSMLFSKEILYPSLKLMLENYDKYIDEKKDKLNEDELTKCYEQKDYIKKMCTVYEEANENDSKEKKAEQLKIILDLLEKCGMPPAELVPEVNPFEGLGNQMKMNGCPVS